MLQKCREVEREKYWQKPVKWERAAEAELQDWKNGYGAESRESSGERGAMSSARQPRHIFCTSRTGLYLGR